MRRVHTIIARGGSKKHGRVCLVSIHHVIRRKVLHVLPVVGVRVAILSHPGRTSKEFGVAAHVQERNLTHHRAKQVGTLHKGIANEEASIGSTAACQVLSRRHLCFDEVLGNGKEVLIGLLSLLLECRFMPVRPELSATADIGNNIAVPLLEPSDTNFTRIARLQRHFKTSVPIQLSLALAVSGNVALDHQKVRNHCAVGRSSLALHDS
mmetsp:Transcript_103749/g.167267  ORF Transcript_103749/g.167267 Transcript_103749/m.167267 type:complete len:209 (-) Transcript_103749:1012-1638(-)